MEYFSVIFHSRISLVVLEQSGLSASAANHLNMSHAVGIFHLSNLDVPPRSCCGKAIFVLQPKTCHLQMDAPLITGNRTWDLFNDSSLRSEPSEPY